MKLTSATQSILAALRTAGTPIIVGGAVRDWILDPETIPADIDIEVFGATHDDILQAFDSSAIADDVRIDAVGADFGVFKVVFQGEQFDVALPRKESRIGAKHTDFLVTHDPDITFEEAFARRDFTINAIGFDPATSTIIDPFGGCDDLLNSTLRHTSDAFAEDPLRVLRGVQFTARFDLVICWETLELFQQLADQFSTISSDRVWGELRKLFEKGVRIDIGITLLDMSGWAEKLGIGWQLCVASAQDVSEHCDNLAIPRQTGLDRVVMVMAAACFELEPTVLGDFLHTAGVPGGVQFKVAHLIKEAWWMDVAPTKASVMHMRRRLERLSISFGQVHTIAKHVGFQFAQEWLDMAVKTVGDFNPPFVTGKFLIDMGMEPGPQFGTIIAKALWAQDESLLTSEEMAKGFVLGATSD